MCESPRRRRVPGILRVLRRSSHTGLGQPDDGACVLQPRRNPRSRFPLSLSRLVSLHGGGSASRGKALVLAMRVCGRFQFVAAGTQGSSTDSTNCVRDPWSSLFERRGEERGRRAGLWLANGAHGSVEASARHTHVNSLTEGPARSAVA
jgi:hypothetical protein